jgi:hypothetical protein
MTAVLQEQDYEGLDPVEALKLQLEAKKNNALPKQKTNEISISESSGNSQSMGEGTEGEEGTDDNEIQKGFFRFQKGNENYDIDPEAILEFNADGKTVKMSLKQLRDAAAGGVAVRNRMRQLAEQKKALLDPFVHAGKKAMEDPMSALKHMFSVVQKVNPELNFKQFLQSLGKQAQNLSKMAPSERESYELKQQLQEEKERNSKVLNEVKMQKLSAELMQDTGLSEEKIFKFGEQILSNPVLKATIKDEEDLFTRIGDLAEEVELQQASYNALHKFNPKMTPRDPLVFELSKVLRQNPDFDERDLLDIAKGVVGNVQRTDAARVLSKKQRSSAINYKSPERDIARMNPVDALKAQIEAKKKQLQQSKKR